MVIHRLKEIIYNIVFLQKELRGLMKGRLVKLRIKMERKWKLGKIKYHSDRTTTKKKINMTKNSAREVVNKRVGENCNSAMEENTKEKHEND